MVGAERLFDDHSRNGCQRRRRLAFHHARPDGTDYPNRIVYREIEKPTRLVYDHGADGGARHSLVYDHGADGGARHFQTVVTFAPMGVKTKVTMRATFDRIEAFEAASKYAIEGGKQTLARLDEYVSSAAR